MEVFGSMKRRIDLIDQFTDLVVGSDEPRRLAERTLEVIMSLNNGRSGAVFSREGEGVTLFASRGVDQRVLELVEGVWSRERAALSSGEVLYVPDRNTDRRFKREAEHGGPVSFALVPVLRGDAVSALLYVDSLDPHFLTPHDVERLKKFTKIVGKAVGEAGGERAAAASAEAWETYLERTPVEDMEREKLLLLLNRNEWNIARVARLMGVTRRTIYLRLQRYNIPRERVRKTRAPKTTV
jgi:transcriptional regulator with GAF, ATPase, and Fis domain